MVEYCECELGQICSRLSSGKGISAKNITGAGEYPVYGGNGLRGYTGLANFDGDCAIIGRQGAFCGNVRYFSGKAYMTEHAVIVCANESNNTRFLSYLLSTMSLGRLSGQSAQPGLSVKTLAQQIVKIPPKEEQKKIAAVLSSLDNKIELNTEINHNLEQQAQAVFKSWFVDFEPWDGVIPDDWREGTLSDICCYNSDRISVSSLSLSTYLSTENMVANKGGFVNAASLPTITQTTKFDVGDTLISNIRPYFKKIVYCNFAGGCSTDVLCFRPQESSFSLFLFNLLYNDRFFNYMVAGSKGTKMPRGDKQQIMNYQTPIPDKSILNDFAGLVSPIMEKINLLNVENDYLAAMRDALLPKLMSGELSVADI